MIRSLFGFVIFTAGVLSCHALLFVSVIFSVQFSIVITLLGEDRAGLSPCTCTSRAFVSLFCTRPFLSLFAYFLGQGLTAACDCGTP